MILTVVIEIKYHSVLLSDPYKSKYNTVKIQFMWGHPHSSFEWKSAVSDYRFLSITSCSGSTKSSMNVPSRNSPQCWKHLITKLPSAASKSAMLVSSPSAFHLHVKSIYTCIQLTFLMFSL